MDLLFSNYRLLLLLIFPILSYSLKATQYHKDRNDNFFCAFLQDTNTEVDNTNWACGAFPVDHPLLGQDYNPDLIYDRFSNAYAAREIAIPKNEDCFVCDQGYFELTFSENFANKNLRDVICDVFQYVSEQVIQRPSLEECPPEPVRIFISDDWTNNGAAATPYYSGFITNGISPNESILNNRVFTKINGGNAYDPYSNGDPDFPTADGRLRINPDLNYYYDWEMGAPAPGSQQVDAFTVILHEAMHLLGVAATMGSGFHFSTWDRFLFANEQNFITGIPNQNSWAVNPEVIVEHNVGNCGTNQRCIDLTWANEALSSQIVFDADPLMNGLDYPVPGGLLNGTHPLGNYLNSISHLGEGQDQVLDANLYLMAPTRPVETIFRNFTAPETNILCALGYNTSGCNGCFNIANADFNINLSGDRDEVCNPVNLIACTGSSITITPNDLLGNDYPTGNDLEITFLGSVTNGVIINGPDINGNYTVTSDRLGRIMIQYVVNACDGYMVPQTSRIQLVFSYCPPCDNDPCDNLLCVDDFEDIETMSNIGSISSNFPHFFSVFSFNNSPDLYYSSVSDNHFLYMIGASSTLESWVFELTEPIPPGCTLDLSFVAQEQNANNSSIVIWGSENPPCPPEDTFIPFDCNVVTNCAGYQYAPICLGDIDISGIPPGNGDSMMPVAGTFTNTGNTSINFLLIYSDVSGAFFDDFVATRSCPSVFTFTTDCLDASFTANPAPEGYNVLWIFGDGTTANQPNVTHTYATPGTYNVTLTLTDGSCPENQEVFTQNVIVDLEACENPPLACQCTDLVLDENSGIDLSISSLVSNEILPPNQLDLSNGQCLTINGDLLIDQDYEIIGGEIFMEAGASIIVDEFRRLRLSQINEGDGIHGCSMMWEGIKLRKGCSLNIDKCMIQDAHLAVDVAADINQFQVVNTTFENNYIGIYSGPQTVYVADFHWFYGNTFQYSDNEEYLPAYPGQLNDPGTKSYAGIALSNVSSHIRLGLSSLYNFPANNFDNLRNGILTDDLSLHITNTNFSNINRIAGDVNSGFAVKHEGGSGHDISIVGVDAPNGNSSVNFTDCTVGVDITGTNTIIISSDFAEVGNGINVRQAHLRKIDINANSIQAHSRGIRLDNNDPGLGADVFNNNITIGILPNEFGVALPGVGIEVNETGLPAYELATNSISNNTIATVNGDIAIKLQDVEEYFVNGNTLSLQGNGAKGITAYSMISGNLVDNTITGQSQWVQVGGTLEEHTPQEAGIHGIDLELSPGVTLECNNVSNLETGVYFYGECLGSDMVGTRFTPPFTKGLHYAEQLSITTQPHHGNIWEPGTYGTNGEGAAAVNDVPAAGFNITLQNQLYEIHTNTNGYRPPSFAFPMLPFFQQGDAANLWFIQGSGEPLDCSQFDADGFTDNDEKNLAKSAIDGELVRGEYTSTRSWISRWQVYQQYYDEVVTDQQINQFLTNEASEDLGQLHTREQSRKSMHLGDPVLLSQLQDNEERLQILITELADLDQRGAQGEVVQQERLDVQLEITEIIESLMALDSDRITSRNQEGQVYVNASPTFPVTPAEQLAQVQAIYGKTLGQGNLQLNSTDANDLLSIGDNCPLLGGVAVYKARSLYQLLVDPLYSFTNNCLPTQALQSLPVVTENNSEVDRQVESVSESPQGALLAWPNPADNLLNIRLGTEVQQLLISDGFGRVYFRSSNRERKTLSISTENWPNGLYLVTAFDEQGQLIGSQKTIIIH